MEQALYKYNLIVWGIMAGMDTYTYFLKFVFYSVFGIWNKYIMVKQNKNIR